MNNKNCSLIFISLLIMMSCGKKNEQKPIAVEAERSIQGTLSISPFGKLADGTPVSLYTMKNSKGMVMKVINYGGIIVSLTAPDKNGKLEDVVLGYDSLKGYVDDNDTYFGSLVGRYGNRIAKGKFTLDGTAHSLATNNGVNHLHGGNKGFNRVFWNIEERPSEDGVALTLSYVSKDMEEGYPGTLQVEVVYTLTNKNELRIDYKATTDKKTIINLTQHSYFKLNPGVADILSHELLLNGDKFLAVDKTLIPAGSPKDVANTPFDFRTPALIGSRINEKDEQLKFGNGYDHCWVLNEAKDGLNHAATVYDSITGRELTVYTTEPGIQFYSGNFLNGSGEGKKGIVYNFRNGLCLETQHFPNSPNRSDFPSVVLNPGETYTSQTIYKFSAR
jgi:aldose 1-epimerase